MAPRPFEETQEFLDALDRVIEETAVCTSGVRAIVKRHGISFGNAWRYLKQDNRFKERYARAKIAQAELIADEILDIADYGLNDSQTDENGNTTTNNDVVKRSILRVDTRKWMLSKLLPKIYGDRVVQEHEGKLEVAMTVTIKKPD